MRLKLCERTEKDWEAFLRMGKSFHSASPYSGMSFSEEKLRQIFDYPHWSILILFLVDDNDNAVGVLMGQISTPYFSEEKTASELAWWVDPKHRKTKASLDLVYAYEDWAYRMGAKKVTLASLEGLSPPRISKLYESMGFKLAEQAYIKDF